MKINTEHTDIIISAGLKCGYPAHGFKSAVHRETGECAEQESHYGIIGETAATNPYGGEYRCKQNKTKV
jgi:hypothetical protein